MTIYLSPNTQHFQKDPLNYGCMFNIVRQIGRQYEALRAGCWWMLDNGQFGDKWTWALWWQFLIAMLPYRDRCLGIPIPDKLADYIMTLHFFRVFQAIPRELGYPVALVTQDGMTPEMIPWSLVDCLFIGGSNYHKRGIEADLLIGEAKRRGIWVHVGRVQAGSTMLKYWPEADSFDGTTLIKNPTQQEASISTGVTRIRQGQIPYTLKMF